MYKLKRGQENFEVVDGEFAGKKFVKGRQYPIVPPDEMKRFERVESQGSGVEGRESRVEGRKTKAAPAAPEMKEV